MSAKSLLTLIAAASISISVSACSSTLAPEDDATTEYVFEQQVSESDVVAKDYKTKNQDTSDD